MEAVIGHPRHSDQCHRYYQDFRRPGPRRQAPPRPKGNREEGADGVGRWSSTACYSCIATGQLLLKVFYWQLAIQHVSRSLHAAHWHFSSAESVFSASSHLSPCLINGTPAAAVSGAATRALSEGSCCVQSIAGIAALTVTASGFCFGVTVNALYAHSAG